MVVDFAKIERPASVLSLQITDEVREQNSILTLGGFHGEDKQLTLQFFESAYSEYLHFAAEHSKDPKKQYESVRNAPLVLTHLPVNFGINYVFTCQGQVLMYTYADNAKSTAQGLTTFGTTETLLPARRLGCSWDADEMIYKTLKNRVGTLSGEIRYEWIGTYARSSRGHMVCVVDLKPEERGQVEAALMGKFAQVQWVTMSDSFMASYATAHIDAQRPEGLSQLGLTLDGIPECNGKLMHPGSYLALQCARGTLVERIRM